ncbi:unnamed protein product [Closterium sp. NIES-64]|nr:unnamed protein product [Closterium sp. NIES-64]
MESLPQHPYMRHSPPPPHPSPQRRHRCRYSSSSRTLYSSVYIQLAATLFLVTLCSAHLPPRATLSRSTLQLRLPLHKSSRAHFLAGAPPPPPPLSAYSRASSLPAPSASSASAPPPSPPPPPQSPVTEPIPPPPPPPAGGSNVGVFIGVGVALGVLLLAAIAGVLYVWLVRRQQREQGDRNLDRGRAAVFAAMHSANKNRWWFGGKGSGVGGSLRSKGSKGELTSKRSEGDTGAEKDSKELGDVGSAESGKLVDGNMMQGISSEVFTRESSLGEGVGGDIREGR